MYFLGSKEVVELMAEIQKFMFTHNNAPLHVSTDKTAFFKLMFAFHNYESTVCLERMGVNMGN